MWEVFEHRRVVRRLRKLPTEVLKRYEKWKDIVGISGPTGLRRIKGFHDEILLGDWRGHRSSQLGGQYRVIYKIAANELLVLVINLAAHDYRKR